MTFMTFWQAANFIRNQDNLSELGFSEAHGLYQRFQEHREIARTNRILYGNAKGVSKERAAAIDAELKSVGIL